MLVVMTGLPGTGKSTLAHEVLRTARGIRLDKDRIRPALFPPAEIDYTAAQDDVCVEAMLLAAEYLFGKDRTRLIVLDGRPFVKRRQREQVLDWAARLSVVPVLIECICPEELARERLERDCAQHLAGNRDFALYQSLKAQWEPIVEPHLTIDTSQSLQQCVRAVLDALRTASYH